MFPESKKTVILQGKARTIEFTVVKFTRPAGRSGALQASYEKLLPGTTIASISQKSKHLLKVGGKLMRSNRCRSH